MDLEAVVDAFVAAEQSASRRREGLDTVRKLLINVRDCPAQEKYRRVNKTNNVLKSRLFPECFDLLRAAGFQDNGEFLAYLGNPAGDRIFQEACGTVESLLLSMGEAPKPCVPAATSSTASAPASSSQPPAESKRAIQQRQQEKAREDERRAQASAQEQLAALRLQRSGRYQQQQDAALARHLSSRDADEPYDAIAALNNSGSVHSFVSCSRCGSLLRYSANTRAGAVLCPCGRLLVPVHMRGQGFASRSLSDLPVEPGEPVDADNQPRTRGPFITVRGPNGEPAQLPLHSVLQMVRQNEARQTAGAADDTIEALPTRTYDAGVTQHGVEGTNCQICMEDYAEGDELRTLPCFHLFHAKCVDQWLKVNSICPTCRHKVG